MIGPSVRTSMKIKNYIYNSSTGEWLDSGPIPVDQEEE